MKRFHVWSGAPGVGEGWAITEAQYECIGAIIEERRWQDQRHGVVEEYGHTVGEWILIAERELAEAKEGLLKGGTGRNRPMHELVQVAATCLAALEQHGFGDLPSKWGGR